jgi:lysyl-tRNA synthetase class 2
MDKDVLAIDDLDTEPCEIIEYDNVLSPIIDLISYRYEHQLPTIITSNLTPQQISEVYGKRIECRLIQPTFVTHLPKELCPLAKITADDPTTIDVFELVIGGKEIAPAYSEQNDPFVQRQMLEAQAGEEVQKIDHDFLTAMEHGMPPAGGMGIGIDRLAILLTGAANIRDVILFPTLRPEGA